MTPCQFSFRPNFSTEAALIEVTDFMKQSIDCGLFAAAIFVDLTKAFDSITHDILFFKIRIIGCLWANISATTVISGR